MEKFSSFPLIDFSTNMKIVCRSKKRGFSWEQRFLIKIKIHYFWQWVKISILLAPIISRLLLFIVNVCLQVNITYTLFLKLLFLLRIDYVPT